MSTRAAAESAAVKADTTTIHLVELFLKIPVRELPPDQVDRFLAVSPEGLPKKLRAPYHKLKLELEGLMRLSRSKKKGLVVMPYDQCDQPSKGETAATLLSAGYKEITDDEENYLIRMTKCTEMDQTCDFTLRIVDEPPAGKKKPGRRRYFLFCDLGCDPLMILIGFERKHIHDRGTNFFGAPSYPTCVH